MCQVLWKAARFRGLPPEQAMQLLIDLVAFPLFVTPLSELLPRALALSLVSDLAVYDCIFIAMAERLACPLNTVDERQSQVASAGGVQLKAISEFQSGA
jgi:predicted nucleic acid-binding protein